MIEIRQAATAEEFSEVGRLYLAFKEWLEKTYPELMPIAGPFFSQLQAEIETFPGIYSPPGAASCSLAMTDSPPAPSV